MWPTIEADGDTWEVRLDRHDPHAGVRAVVFSCVSNPQRAYHVTEVPESVLPGQGEAALNAVAADTLAGWFAGSDPMDYIHEPDADPVHPGGHPIAPPPPEEREEPR